MLLGSQLRGDILLHIMQDPTQILTLHEESLSKAEEFAYPRCTFKADGIDWESHFKRLAISATAAAASLCSAGLTARNVGLGTALTLFGSFVRPVIEYCLAFHKPHKVC